MINTLRFFPWSAIGNDGFPTVSSPVSPLSFTGKEVNLRQVSYTPNIVTTELPGDDRKEVVDVVSDFTVEVQLNGVGVDFLAGIGLGSKDSKGNFHAYSQVTQHGVLFVRGKNQKGALFERWFHDVVAKPLSQTQVSQLASETADPITISFRGTPLPAPTGHSSDIPYSEVYSGNTGFVGAGVEPQTTDYYKG